MQQTPEQIERLKNTIERVVGRKIVYPKDFEFLAKQVEGYAGEHISISTLKRMWGYVNISSNISIYTLNLLSRMVGYADWEEFSQSCSAEANEENSHKIVCRKLFTSALTRGDMISIVWKPARKITIQYEGQDQFVVVESENSKLQKDDVFHCLQFIEHQPLLLMGLYRKGMPPCDFICGQNGGIVWNFIDRPKAQS